MLGDNLKVHFAGSDNDISASVALEVAGVNYNLYSCYPFIVNKKPTDDFRMKQRLQPIMFNQERMNHVIQDSGLFTLMFGAKKGEKQTKQSLTDWQDKLMEFVKQNNITATCVEIDCQKVLGVEEAWYFRERMKENLPNRQINVFHMEDGMKGLDRLIEFSDYIAFSIPELRICRKGQFKQFTKKLVSYTKNKKPEIDIHLLGCTDREMLQQNRECTTSDSSSWISGLRYGTVLNRHIDTFNKDVFEQTKKKVIECFKRRNIVADEKKIITTTNFALCAMIQKQRYTQFAGSQE